MISCTLNNEKIWDEHLTDLSTSPLICIHFTLGNPKKSFSTVLLIHTFDYLCYLRRKQTLTHWPTPPEYVTTLTCEMLNFLIWLQVCFILSNVGGSDWMAMKRTSFVAWQLWCRACNLPGSVQSGHLVHGCMFPVFFCHWSVASYTMTQQVTAATRHIADWYLIHALLL